MGWTGLENGALLSKAAAEFDVFLTVDRNLSFQQNVGKYDLAIIVIHAASNTLADLAPRIPDINTALASARPGTVLRVGT